MLKLLVETPVTGKGLARKFVRECKRSARGTFRVARDESSSGVADSFSFLTSFWISVDFDFFNAFESSFVAWY